MTTSENIEPPQSKIAENKTFLIEQSKMLQEVIKRMANNSLELKKSGLVAWTAIVGFGLSYRIATLFLLALLFSLILALLDVFYLQQERKFRTHFNILTKIICGYPLSPSELRALALTEPIDSDVLMDRVEGNFLKLFVKPEQSLTAEELVHKKAKQSAEGRKDFWIAAMSWANLLYPIIFAISIILFFTPLPPSSTPTSPQASTPTVSPSVAATPSLKNPSLPQVSPPLPAKR